MVVLNLHIMIIMEVSHLQQFLFDQIYSYKTLFSKFYPFIFCKLYLHRQVYFYQTKLYATFIQPRFLYQLVSIRLTTIRLTSINLRFINSRRSVPISKLTSAHVYRNYLYQTQLCPISVHQTHPVKFIVSCMSCFSYHICAPRFL